MDTLPHSTSLPQSRFLELESTQRHIDLAARYVAERFMAAVNWKVNFHQSLESPIEVLFMIWWNALVVAQDIDDHDITWSTQQQIETSSGRRYRLDFVMEPTGNRRDEAEALGLRVAKIAVELDGHDFHERTKEQVAYRNQRDRDLQADGWIVLHFSGSEMFRDPVTCITQVYEQTSAAFGDLELRIAEAAWLRDQGKAAALKDGQAV